jgi:hypothetical protein
MMVFEKFYGIGEHFSGWRCVACGEIIDRIILVNRDLEESMRDLVKHRKISRRYA